MDLDLWKRDNFMIKDAVLLCLFLIGIHFLSVLPLRIFRVNLIILYDMIFLGIVLVMLKQSGRDEIKKILKWRKIPFPLLCALLVMFFGLEIIRREVGNVMNIILPVPEGFFNIDNIFQDSVFTVFVNYALFPAVTEELFFRGIILKRLRGSYTKKKALVVSSLLFGLMHLNPWQALLAAISGLFFGWIYMEFKTIWLCMFMHGYNNIMATFIPFPVQYLPNTRSYAIRTVQPLWFDIMGIILFVAGLGLTWGISRERRAGGRKAAGRQFQR
jgi:membrane protease YdiL (CAAX protease family)